MTIERLSFPEGLPIKDRADFVPADIVASNFDRLVTLPIGEYDITPKIWRRHVYRYNVLVKPDGSATLRMIPRFSDAQSQVVCSEGKSPFQGGGRLINIPDDETIYAIAGPKRDDPQIYLFELLFHLPGPSPKDV